MEGDFGKPTKVVGPYAVLETKATDRLARPLRPKSSALKPGNTSLRTGLTCSTCFSS